MIKHASEIDDGKRGTPFVGECKTPVFDYSNLCFAHIFLVEYFVYMYKTASMHKCSKI